MIEEAEASGELEPGRRLLEPTSGNTGISLALVAKLKGYPLTCVLPENATRERRRLLRLYGADIIESPGAEGSNGAVRLALELAERDPSWFMPFQYANEANPRAHYEGTGAEIADALERVDVLVAGLGTGGTLMGTGDRLRESFPDVVVAAAEPLPGEPVMGLRSLEDGYVPPILDVSKLDRKLLVSNEESVAGAARAARHGGHLRRRLRRRGRPRRPPARRRARRGRRRLHPRRRRLEVPLRRLLGRGGRRELDGADRLVVIPAAVRGRARRARARRGAERGVRPRRRSATASPNATSRAATPPPRPTASSSRSPPETWFLEDEGYELAVFHSHLSSPPRPSRTDVENIGLWQGKPVPDPLARLRLARRLDDPRAGGSSRSRSPERTTRAPGRPFRTGPGSDPGQVRNGRARDRRRCGTPGCHADRPFGTWPGSDPGHAPPGHGGSRGRRSRDWAGRSGLA